MSRARAITPEEAEAYCELRREMLLDSPWAFTASPEDDRGSDVAWMRTSLGNEGSAVLGVVEEGRVLACAGLLREARPKRRHLALVWGVYVTPRARGRGLGRAVVGAAIERARGWTGVSSLYLMVSEGAPAAKRLYESLGFVAWGTEPDAVRIGEVSYAETYMRLALG